MASGRAVSYRLQVSPQMFDGDTKGHSGTCPEATPVLFLAVCLGSCWKVNCRESEFAFPVPAAEKDAHGVMQPPPRFSVGTVLVRWCAVPGFLALAQCVLFDPLCCRMPLTRQRLVSCHFLIYGVLRRRLSIRHVLRSLHRSCGALYEWLLRSFFPPWPRAFFGQTANARKVRGCAKLFPFQNDRGRSGPGNTRSLRNRSISSPPFDHRDPQIRFLGFMAWSSPDHGVWVFINPFQTMSNRLKWPRPSSRRHLQG